MKLSDLIEQHKDQIFGDMVMVVHNPVVGMDMVDCYHFVYRVVGQFAIQTEERFCPVIYPEPINYEFVEIANFNNLNNKYPGKWG